VCDGRTDRQTDGRHYDHEDHACIQCSAVKTMAVVLDLVSEAEKLSTGWAKKVDHF